MKQEKLLGRVGYKNGEEKVQHRCELFLFQTDNVVIKMRPKVKQKQWAWQK